MEGKKGSNQGRKVKLLEEISTNPTSGKKETTGKSNLITAQIGGQQAKPTIEDLHSLIMDKLTLLESSHAPPTEQKDSANT